MNSNRLTIRSRIIHYFHDLQRRGIYRLARLDPDAPVKQGTVRDPREIVGFEVKTKSGWKPIKR
ncbi:MAG: hypothetical protein JAZ17_03135 [Candidatus Thiodiazotropha endolucinida]|nr:hypothetical protein [Candidatus Thiodiazotropha endolucinida]